jgi:hypothetical protein
MTGFLKRGRLWVALAAIAVGGLAGQAVFAQISRPAGGSLDPFVTGSLTGGSEQRGSIRRPPTRDPVRPTIRSPFIP